MSIVKVFIADDSDTIRERLIELLAGISGVEIIGEAKDTSQAIASILKLNPEVVVLDIRMPGGSGIEVLKEIKKHVPAPIVIMLTNYPYSQYREKCLKEGADYFFEKATEFKKVIDVLRGLSSEPGN